MTSEATALQLAPPLLNTKTTSYKCKHCGGRGYKKSRYDGYTHVWLLQRNGQKACPDEEVRHKKGQPPTRNPWATNSIMAKNMASPMLPPSANPLLIVGLMRLRPSSSQTIRHGKLQCRSTANPVHLLCLWRSRCRDPEGSP